MSNGKYECLILLQITAERLIGELNVVVLIIQSKINDFKVYEREKKRVDKIIQTKEISVSLFISNKNIISDFKLLFALKKGYTKRLLSFC